MTSSYELLLVKGRYKQPRIDRKELRDMNVEKIK